MYKLIVIDLDGTLLDDQHTMSLNTLNLLNELLEKDIKIIFASGRPMRSMIPYTKSLIKPILLISDNGANIGFSDGSDFKEIKKFNKREFISLFKDNKEYIKNAFYSIENNIYIYNRIPKLEPLYHIDNTTNVIEGSYDEIDIKVPRSAMFIVDTKFKDKFEDYINNTQNIKYRLVGSDTKNSVYEISLSTLNKAKALKKITQYYDIDLNDVIAIGDGDNDLEMLKIAGLGVGMKNASYVIRDNINTITKYDNNHEGVFEFLSSIETTSLL